MKSVILSGGDSIKQTRSCSALYHLLLTEEVVSIALLLFNIGLNRVPQMMSMHSESQNVIIF